jgi:hypothetical protein
VTNLEEAALREIDRLKAEIERKDAALERIVDGNIDDAFSTDALCQRHRTIARQALTEEDK